MTRQLTPNATRVALESRQATDQDVAVGNVVVVRLWNSEFEAEVVGVEHHPVYGQLVDVRPRSLRIPRDCVLKRGRRRGSSAILRSPEGGKPTPAFWNLNAPAAG